MFKNEGQDYLKGVNGAAKRDPSILDEVRDRAIQDSQDAFWKSDASRADVNTPEHIQQTFETIQHVADAVAKAADEIDTLRLAHSIYERPYDRDKPFDSDGFYFFSRASRVVDENDGKGRTLCECRGMLTNGLLHSMLENLCEDDDMADLVVTFAARLMFARFYGSLFAPGASLHDIITQPISGPYQAVMSSKNETIGVFDQTLATMLLLIMSRVNCKNPNTGSATFARESPEMKELFFKEKDSTGRKKVMASFTAALMSINDMSVSKIMSKSGIDSVKEVISRYVEFDLPSELDNMLKGMNIDTR